MGGWPSRRITTDDEVFIVETANQRPGHWAGLSLVGVFTSSSSISPITSSGSLTSAGNGPVRCWRTMTSRSSGPKPLEGVQPPRPDAKLDRIDEVLNTYQDRCFAFDEFGRLQIRPTGGSAWVPAGHLQRQPANNKANNNKLHGVRQFHGCHAIGDDELWGVVPASQVRSEHAPGAEIDPCPAV